ncbi:MAG: adenylate/guanylate cyclase domain-containing protein [Candidatus Entotheonellia bacterium]
MACGHALTAASHRVSFPEAGSTPAVERPDISADQATPRATPVAAPHVPAAERRQLTMLFCDLVDSTALAGQLDPEDLREVVRAYQATCAAVIRGFEGHIAQYLGDGLLVYFGYPQAHEDDALRAVRAGLGMVEAIQQLNTRVGARHAVPLQVRLGIHTGPVVVGPMGAGDRQEQLALGETPNIAARLQGLAAPDTVVLGEATYHLVQGFVTCDDLGAQPLKGVATPVRMYRVLGESGAQSRLDVAVTRGLTPLVGREAEVVLLRRRWALAKDGQGQVVVLSGEAGIGKSRLVQELQACAESEGAAHMTLRCSPYHQQSALYPIIEHLQRWLQFQREDSPEAKLRKLEEALIRDPSPPMGERVGVRGSDWQPAHSLTLALSQRERGEGSEVVPLLAALLSLQRPSTTRPCT